MLSEFDWLSFKPILDQYGLPLAGLLGTLYGLYRVLRWVGVNVVIPIKDRHITFIDNLEKTVNKLADEAKGWKCQASMYAALGRNARPPEAHDGT